MNKVILLGNIGQDAETKGDWTTFSLATNETWKTNGEKKSKTTWHNIRMYKASPAFTQYLTRGKAVVVQGKLVNWKYDGDDGKEQTFHAVQADKFGGVEFAPSSGGSNSQSNTKPVTSEEDEIPF